MNQGFKMYILQCGTHTKATKLQVASVKLVCQARGSTFLELRKLNLQFNHRPAKIQFKSF